MNRLITSTKIESVIKKFPTNKSPGPDVFIGKFYQIFRAELTHTFDTLPNSFYDVTITLILKPDEDTTKKKKKKKKFRPISLMNIDTKNPKQNTSKSNPTKH